MTRVFKHLGPFYGSSGVPRIRIVVEGGSCWDPSFLPFDEKHQTAMLPNEELLRATPDTEIRSLRTPHRPRFSICFLHFLPLGAPPE